MTRPTRTLFVAGATGATGRTLMRLALAKDLDVVPHVRPKSANRPPASTWSRRAEFELANHARLVEALQGRTTVLQLIGTMRKRFASGDTYETSDIGTTRQLVEASKEAGVQHLVLLSSMGAGRPMGAYLEAKAEAERLVRESGLAWTVARPSAFEGEGHHIPGAKLLAHLPGLKRFRPIRVEELASALLYVGLEGTPTGVLEGEPLWDVVRAAASLR